MTKPTTKRAALYARFSSDIQKDRSIDDQLAVCETLAKREGFRIVETFSDRAKSGASMFERDGLLELMAAAKARHFEVVIVESLDRLSRDQEDLAGMFKRLSFFEIEIQTVNEGLATPIHVGIRSIVGSLFLADLGNKVRRGHNGRVRDGKHPTALAYGYRLVDGRPGEREIDPEHAEIVRRIFREYSLGKSPREIARGLNDERVPTPRGAAAWTHQLFVGGEVKRGLIGNPIYLGKLTWNRTRNVRNPETGKTIKRRAEASEHIVTDAPHLRIIDEALWQAANKVRQSRAATKFGEGGKMTMRAYAPRKEHLLAGLLRCGQCGGQMRISSVSRARGARVACAASHRLATCSHGKSYDLDKLQRVTIEALRERLSNPKAIAEYVRGYHEQWQATDKQNSRDRVTAQKQLNRVQVQIERLVNAIASDTDLPVPQLVAKLKPLEIERAGLAERLRWLESERHVVTLHPNALQRFHDSMGKLHRDLAEAEIGPEGRTAFRMLIDSVVVHPTAERAGYEVTPNARLGTLLGKVDLFPAKRSPRQMLEESGVSCSDKGSTANPVNHLSQLRGDEIIPLGRWRAKAA